MSQQPSRMPKAPDHDVRFWRGNSLILLMIGVACWIFLPGAAGFWTMAAFVTLAACCWALTRGRE